ncbi:MAG TPA: hypothetical protein VFG55_01855 [Rhodanobacteraceae bacterium]|nr:hypothetical protein [Rhodanobacteraceae bacterium]
MKVHATVALVAVLFAGSVVAQNDATHSTTYQTTNGELTVNWGQPAAQPAGPAPDFAQLDGDGNGSISTDEAVGYALLSNDFIHADSNRNGSVSKSEYTRWTSES